MLDYFADETGDSFILQAPEVGDLVRVYARCFGHCWSFLCLPIITHIPPESASSNEPEDPLIHQIRELLDTRIRPAVAQDGGDIVFHAYEEDTGIVKLHMRGACAGCPSSTLTLKAGIENLLKHYVPEVKSVEAVL